MDAVDDDGPDLLTLVRDGCRDVAAAAGFVTIDEARLAAYAATLLDRPAGAGPGATGPDPWVAAADGADVEARVALVVTLDAINFGSGYHPWVSKLDGLSGARTMATRLRRWAADQPGATVRADVLAGLDRATVHAIFGQPETAEMVELMGLFTAALNELGEVVAQRHDGAFVALVESAERSAARLVETLAALPSYRDTSTYRGVEVPFLKRAQITAADLHRAFGGRGPGSFDDLHRLTAFADNLVPHVLRVDGVLRLDPHLAASIDRGELLVHGDEPEVELRACGVHAVELLHAATSPLGAALDAAEIDQILWERGGGTRFKAIPRPRARTTAY